MEAAKIKRGGPLYPKPLPCVRPKADGDSESILQYYVSCHALHRAGQQGLSSYMVLLYHGHVLSLCDAFEDETNHLLLLHRISRMQNRPMQWDVLRISPCYGLYIVQLYVSKLDVLPKYDCREVEIIQYHSNNVGYGCQARRVFLMR